MNKILEVLISVKNAYFGETLSFSYMTGEDIFPVSRMLEKESVCKWLFFGPNSPDMTRKYFEPLIDAMENDIKAKNQLKTHIFTIRERISGHFVGQCALLPVDFSEGSYTAAYQLDDICWRRGYGFEACRFLVYYAFFVCGGYRINADCAKENTASCRILEKCGFLKECNQEKYWNYKDSFHDRVLYSLLFDNIPLNFQESLKNEFEESLF